MGDPAAGGCPGRKEDEEMRYDFEVLDGFSALDAVAGVASGMMPVAAGAGVSFGIAQAISFLVKNETVRKWRWVIGGAVAGVVGLGLWKWRSPMEGGIAIATGSLLVPLLGYGSERLLDFQRARAASAVKPPDPSPDGGTLKAFQMEQADPLFAAYQLQQPQPVFAAFQMQQADPLFAAYQLQQPQPVFAGVGQDEVLGAMNPALMVS